jgi:hypothetical protein
MTAHTVLIPSFSDYLLLCLILSAPFIPLVVRIAGDHFRRGSQTAAENKPKQAPEPVF